MAAQKAASRVDSMVVNLAATMADMTAAMMVEMKAALRVDLTADLMAVNLAAPRGEKMVEMMD